MTERILDTSNMDAILHLYDDLVNSDDHFVSIGGLQQNLHKLVPKPVAPSGHRATNGARNNGDGTVEPPSPQQYSTKIASTAAVEVSCDVGDFMPSFDRFPEEMKLQIFSYLGAKDLCMCANVSNRWQCLTSTDYLWSRLLMRDVHRWNMISHDTDPNLYKEIDSHWTWKQIYRHCCPDLQKPKSTGWNLNSLFWTFFQKNTPKIGIFGPGLESKTSRIITHILSDPTKGFKQSGVIPGSFSGVGSFFLMSINNLTFSLTVMYSGVKKDRERAAHEGQQQLRQLPQVEHLKALCRTLDAFVFVIDATDTPAMEWAGTELCNMVNEEALSTQTPVLVLSCIPEDSPQQVATSSSHTMSCFDVVNSLQLTKLNKPWRVCSCVVGGNLDGCHKGFDWIINKCQ